MNIYSRLNKIEKSQGDTFDDVLLWVSQGRYYDELSEAERKRYDDYKCSLGGVDVDKASCYLDNVFNDTGEDAPLHFKLTAERLRPPTKEEYEARVKEIERLVLDEEDNGNE